MISVSARFLSVRGSSGQGSPVESLAAISAMSNDFPAPLGPTIVVSCPAGTRPFQIQLPPYSSTSEARQTFVHGPPTLSGT